MTEPMKYKLRINSAESRGLGEDSIELKQATKVIKETIISPLVNTLEITTLNEICFTDNFAAELKYIYENCDSSNDGYTNNEYSIAVGKTIRINDKPNFGVVTG